MPTTVLVSEATRARLAATREQYGARSMDEAIQRLMRDAAPSAQELFQRNRRKVVNVCKRHGVRKLIAFGSRVRDDRTPASDLDLVAEFGPKTTMFDVLDIQEGLAAAFGCKVDLGSVPDPSSRLAAHIREEGVLLVGAPS